MKLPLFTALALLALSVLCCGLPMPDTPTAAPDATITANEPGGQHELRLVSPDGGRMLTLRCANDIAGLWISQRETPEQCVAIYQSNRDGPVVSVRHPELQPAAAALWVSPDGGRMQIADRRQIRLLGLGNPADGPRLVHHGAP